MPVVFVGHMRVCVLQRLVPVRMAVGARRHGVVTMRVVRVVMTVCVFVLQHLVSVFVAMAFCEMKHDAHDHQYRAGEHPTAAAAIAEHEGKHGSDERRKREH